MATSEAIRPHIAEQSAEALAVLKTVLGAQSTSSPTRLRFCDEPSGQEPQIAVPIEALTLFAEVLEHLAEGQAVTVAPGSSELSPREAADLLNVSDAYLTQLLDRGELPAQGSGEDRRIRLVDLLSFRRRDLARRRKILAELTAEAQEMGLYS